MMREGEKTPPQPHKEMYATSSRPYEAYEALLGIDEDEVRGKDVLDLGSGDELQFARGLRERGVGTRVVSLNPQFAEKEKWGPALREAARGERAVAGIARAQPFRDESFDRVYSLYAIPTWLPNEPTEYARAFREIDRILRPGGEAVLFPVDDFAAKENQDAHDALAARRAMLRDAVLELEKRGYAVSVEPVGAEESRRYGGLYTGERWMKRLRLKKPIRGGNEYGASF